MRYLALACDFDGTLAEHGVVSEACLEALQRVRDSGRRLILVTGRRTEDLLAIFPHASLFDRLVTENGGVVYDPARREERLLGEAPSREFVQALQQRAIKPLAIGRVLVATCQPFETAVLDAIRELGLELQVIFNKGAVMALPSGVNKATGLQTALTELSLSRHNCVGVGDAENDHAFLRLSECAVAVANALPLIQERADWVTRGNDGAGVIELIDQLLADDLRRLEPRLSRHAIPIGTLPSGDDVQIAPYGITVLVAGSSGSGKTTFATSFLERLVETEYQFCVVDPEGDYAPFDGAVALGDREHPPGAAQVLEVLESPRQNAVINLIGLGLAERPTFLSTLWPRLMELRARTGRPHWIVVDEAHHLLPASPGSVPPAPDQWRSGIMLITLQPDHLAPAVLSSVEMIVALGRAEETLRAFAEATGRRPPPVPRNPFEGEEALAWRGQGEPVWFGRTSPRAERRRHVRKYAVGELGESQSFYFRGPDGKLNLRAQNLSLFVQLAKGVDDGTWLHHLRQQHYSRWFREVIKDPELASEAESVERNPGLSPRQSRALIERAIDQRYTLPS